MQLAIGKVSHNPKIDNPSIIFADIRVNLLSLKYTQVGAMVRFRSHDGWHSKHSNENNYD